MKKLLVLVLLGALILGGCYTPPRYSPLTSMTVVLVQRYPAKEKAGAGARMEIYIDGNFQTTVEDNRYAVVPVNDGVHNIFVKVGDIESERLNFTANQRSVPFLASIETKGAWFWKKYIVKLERSTIEDDTGVMTDKPSVEVFK
jgi:hypothetical protein